jgi:hypothetical protein
MHWYSAHTVNREILKFGEFVFFEFTLITFHICYKNLMDNVYQSWNFHAI